MRYTLRIPRDSSLRSTLRKAHLRYLGGLPFATLIFAIFLHSSAFADRIHLIHVTERMVLRDRTQIPAGTDLAVKYDGGSVWIPYMVISIPSVPKTSATAVDQVIFNPPIDGTANQLSAIYQRQEIGGTIASTVKPNSTGLAVAKDEHFKISMREGDYYVVDTKTARGAMLPPSAVNVTPAALASGKLMPIPLVSVETEAPAVAMPPRSERLFAQLKIPYTVDFRVRLTQFSAAL